MFKINKYSSKHGQIFVHTLLILNKAKTLGVKILWIIYKLLNIFLMKEPLTYDGFRLDVN